MVIGNGMLANRFSAYQQNDAFLVFASGVSNSGNLEHDQFSREAALVKDSISNNPDKKFVYFSTCSIYDTSMSSSPYVKHKLEMEQLITKLAKDFVIVRLSNPVGHTSNKHTVLNFFVQHIRDKQEMTVWKNASRNIIDIDDMFTITDHILVNNLFGNRIVNVANPHNYSVPAIIEAIETHLKTTGHYHFADKGNGPEIDVSDIEPLFRQFNINFTAGYLPHLLEKYFPLS